MSGAAEDRALIVWCAAISWDRVPRINDRPLVEKMLRHADILWVDPPVSPMTKAEYIGSAGRYPWPTLTRIGPSLHRLTPRAHPFHRRVLTRLTAALVRRQIKWALRRMQQKPYAVVVTSLDDVLGCWGDDVLDVIYGTDDWVAGAVIHRVDPRKLERAELWSLEQADRAVVITPMLADRWRKLGFTRPLAVVPNGVNVSAYAGMDGVEPAKGIDLEPPVAGVMGHLSARIDISLLESVLAAGCSLLLVGPRDPAWEPKRFDRLLAHPRVRWVGPQPFETLPSYLKWIDVGLTPYADSHFNRASFPLKTLEYLAAGKPAVSTDLPAVRWFDTDLITVAGGERFGAAVREAALQPANEELKRRRISFASEHTWEQRAEAFAAAIGLTPVRG